MKTRKIQFFPPFRSCVTRCEIGRLLKRPSQLFKNISNSTKKQKPVWFCFAGLRRKAAPSLRFHEILIHLFFQFAIVKKGIVVFSWLEEFPYEETSSALRQKRHWTLFIYFFSRSLALQRRSLFLESHGNGATRNKYDSEVGKQKVVVLCWVGWRGTLWLLRLFVLVLWWH